MNLSKATDKQLLNEIEERLKEGVNDIETGLCDIVPRHLNFEYMYIDQADELNYLDKQVTRLSELTPELREIVECAARIAFGDYSDLPRLKLLFNNARVFGHSPTQLELLLYRE